MTDEILDVDLLAFESGDDAVRRAVVDGVMRSLETGFVYTTHDVSGLSGTLEKVTEMLPDATVSQDAFDSDASSGKLLRKYLLALEARVNSLGECGKLVIAALDMAWLGRDEVFVGLYVRFLVSLSRAQSKYIPAILERLVSQFAKLPAWAVVLILGFVTKTTNDFSRIVSLGFFLAGLPTMLAVRSGMIAQGPEVKAFEEEFSAQLAGGRECVAVNSGTSGQHLGMLDAVSQPTRAPADGG